MVTEGLFPVVEVVEHQRNVGTYDGELDCPEIGAAGDYLHPDVRERAALGVGAGRTDIPVGLRIARPDVRLG
jgi:hypothetical protein